MRAILVWMFVACGSPRTTPPSDGASPPPSTTVPESPVAAPPTSGSAGAAAIAWQWDTKPDLFPAVDLEIQRGAATYVLAQPRRRTPDREDAIELRGPGWVAQVGRHWHIGAAMVADDAHVYAASYSRAATGCELAAVATATGQEVWRVRLDGIGEIGHSKYSNRVQLRLIGGNPTVFGDEAQRYIEQRDAATGARVSHQLLSRARQPIPISEPVYHELDHLLTTRTVVVIDVDDFLSRHLAMVGSDRATRSGAFRDAVHALDGLPVVRGAYRLELRLVDAGATLELRAKRLPRS